METHAPPGYVCPFCAVVAGIETEHNAPADVVLRDEHATAFVSPKWWLRNEGHVLVVPNVHYEHVYEIPELALGAVYWSAATIAGAIRESYGCDGISTRQHNEPGAGQDVWHFHVHVFPRYAGDDLYRRDDQTRWTTAEERALYAGRLATVLADYPPPS